MVSGITPNTFRFSTCSPDRTILEWRGRIGTEDGSKCLLALGDVYAELDDFEEATEHRWSDEVFHEDSGSKRPRESS